MKSKPKCPDPCAWHIVLEEELYCSWWECKATRARCAQCDMFDPADEPDRDTEPDEEEELDFE